MKPFLGINLTTHKKNEEVNGDVFLVAKPDPALTRSFELSSENVEETIKKASCLLQYRSHSGYAEYWELLLQQVF